MGLGALVVDCSPNFHQPGQLVIRIKKKHGRVPSWVAVFKYRLIFVAEDLVNRTTDRAIRGGYARQERGLVDICLEKGVQEH